MDIPCCKVARLAGRRDATHILLSGLSLTLFVVARAHCVPREGVPTLYVLLARQQSY